jgi:hypothetical protein
MGSPRSVDTNLSNARGVPDRTPHGGTEEDVNSLLDETFRLSQENAKVRRSDSRRVFPSVEPCCFKCIADHPNKTRRPSDSSLHLEYGMMRAGVPEPASMLLESRAKALGHWIRALNVRLGSESDLRLGGHGDCPPLKVYVAPVEGDEGGGDGCT